ncbi:MAG: hypothetical protein V2A76_01080 [Planctomycetota bacterium]
MKQERPTEDPLFRQDVHAALAEIPEGLDQLKEVSWLRKRLEPEPARAAAELLQLRRRAKARFDPGTLAYLTSRGLEQATPQAVADLRASLLKDRIGRATIHDATCGIGSDAIALARAGLEVSCSDADPRVLACAHANLERLGFAVSCRVAKADTLETGADFLLIDPDRRPDGHRTLDPERWSPPLSVALQLASRHRGAMIKLPPSFQPDRSLLGDIPSLFRWVSVNGELAEVGLWTGALVEEPCPKREAIALLGRRGRGGVARLLGEEQPVEALEEEAARRIRYLSEPDVAVINSGLLGELCRRTGTRPVAPGIAYLGGDRPADSPLLCCFRVLGTSTLDRKKVRALLAEHDVGPVTVKKRGHPDSSAVLEKRLRGPGKKHGLLAVTRLEETHLAYLLERTSSPPAP